MDLLQENNLISDFHLLVVYVHKMKTMTNISYVDIDALTQKSIDWNFVTNVDERKTNLIGSPPFHTKSYLIMHEKDWCKHIHKQ